jgi:hypothetical protein
MTGMEIQVRCPTVWKKVDLMSYLHNSRVMGDGRELRCFTDMEILDVTASKDDVLKDFIAGSNRPFGGPILSAK